MASLHDTDIFNKDQASNDEKDSRTLGVGYAMGSFFLVAILCSTLLVWRLTQKSISVTDISTRRGEIFYWTAILFSNTVGTALGDSLADNSGLWFCRRRPAHWWHTCCSSAGILLHKALSHPLALGSPCFDKNVWCNVWRLADKDSRAWRIRFRHARFVVNTDFGSCCSYRLHHDCE